MIAIASAAVPSARPVFDTYTIHRKGAKDTKKSIKTVFFAFLAFFAVNVLFPSWFTITGFGAIVK